jgi:hypothetical protein
MFKVTVSVRFLAFAALFVSPLSMCIPGYSQTQPLSPTLTNWPAPSYWQPESIADDISAKASPVREASQVPRTAAAGATPALVFIAMTPCRLVDTRPEQGKTGAWGPPSLTGFSQRDFPIPTNPTCGIPAGAQAYSLNFTVTPGGGPVSFLSAWPTGTAYPGVSTLNDPQGVTIANAAIVPAGTNGSITVVTGEPTHLIIDINGYYVLPNAVPMTGTAAAPALTFSNTNTGLYSTATDSVSVATGGTARLTVRGDGDLDLTGNIRKNGVLFIHDRGGNFNTGVGTQALAAVTTGLSNVAVGSNALAANSIGIYNTALGDSALPISTIGNQNVGIGAYALRSNTTGGDNIAIGAFSVFANGSGSSNIGIGAQSLWQNTGNNNIAIGLLSGENLTTGGSNIEIGNQGVAGESFTMRLGQFQNRTFMVGIRGVTTGQADAVNVVVDSKGQLGTINSSRRFKQDIKDMGDLSSDLMRLRPVTFRYQQHASQGSERLDYGLIAEEVAQIYPDLVVSSPDGQVETVQYHKLNAMLLNELQKQQAKITRQQTEISRQQVRMQSIESELQALKALLRR